MGSRVTRKSQSKRVRPAPQEGVSSVPSKYIHYFAEFLRFVGRPFYFLITFILTVSFNILWDLGETILKFGQGTIRYLQLISKEVTTRFNYLQSLTEPKKKKRGRPKKKKFKEKAFSFPKFIFPVFAFPNLPKLPKVSLPNLILRLILELKFPRLHIVIPKVIFRIFLFFLPSILLSALIWIWVLKDLPKPGALATRDQVVSTKIYDRKGRLLYKVYRNENRTLVPLEEIPLKIRQATIAIEDADFYSHPGFSIKGITRAFFKNTTRGELTGGSTITQQLVKNTLLSSEKTYTRKAKELILSTQVEMNFTKDQILTMYLNQVGYGGASYGVKEAAAYYFGKDLKDLDLAEITLLAGLPQAPTTYSPFGANPQKAKQRQLEVLEKMTEQGYITSEEAQAAGEEELHFTNNLTDIKAPHFVMYIKQLLADKYGEEAVEEGGLEVTTSLDLDIQEMAEKVVAQETAKIKNLGISNGAALITDPKTGEVLAMVGSKDYFDSKNDGNYNVTTALRQPGSSIKPINYSYAIDHHIYTAASIIQDAPITYAVAGSPPYSPKNYDNTYRGNVTLRTALASSLNVPAVKILATYGVKNMIAHAQNMGITTWNNPSRFGLSLTLGGGEVKMIDMNVAYGAFANEGKRTDLHPILKVTNYKGQTLETDNCNMSTQPFTAVSQSLNNVISKAHAEEATSSGACDKQVLDPRTAFIITNILSDNNARTPVFGPRSKLVIPNHPEVAVKTGTTQNLRDNWAIGYTKDYVVATWVGNNNNKPMGYVASGVTGATPIWQDLMISLTKDKPSASWQEPQGIIKTEICPRTGSLPCTGCGGKTEYFLLGTEPKAMCTPVEATGEAQIISQ